MKNLFLLVASFAWMVSSQAQSADRITYTITGTGFSTTENEMVELTQSVTTPSFYLSGSVTIAKPEFTFHFTKPADINSKSFNQAIILVTKIPSIEFKIYAAGAADPYISYQLKNITLLGFKPSAAAGGSPFLENISLYFENWGFKDWVNNLSYGFNVLTQLPSAY